NLRLALAKGDTTIDCTEADGVHPFGVKIRHGMLVYLATIGHQHRIHRLCVGIAGDASALRGDLADREPERFAELAEFGVATVDDEHRLIERRDIFREPRIDIGTDVGAATDFYNEHESEPFIS